MRIYIRQKHMTPGGPWSVGALVLVYGGPQVGGSALLALWFLLCFFHIIYFNYL